MSFVAKQRLLCFLFPLLLALPFLNRAYFVDDSYFVEIASWLKNNPLKPYDFRTDDAGPQNLGWEKNGFVRMVNPLGHQYYLALLLKIGGEHEWFLRLGCVLLSCFSGLLIFEFARRWTSHPFMAALLTMVTPVFWLTSYSLLIDGTMACFFFAALFYFIRGQESDSVGKMIVSGIFMGFAILSKYPALFIIPLTMAWTVLRWKKTRRHGIVLIAWAIALLFLGIYSGATAKLYGAPHIIAASRRMVQVYGWGKGLVFLIFFSGAALVPLLAWLAASKSRIVAGVLAIILGCAFFCSSWGGFQIQQGFLLSLWLSTSLLFLLSIVSMRHAWIFPRDHFLAIWIFGFIAMMFIVMGWVAARYYMIAIPAITFFAVRMVEERWPQSCARILQGTFIFVLLVSASLAYADYRQAEPSRLVGAELRARGINGGTGHYYLGDSFTMSYLKKDGWIPCFPQTELHPGDLVLTKEVTMPRTSILKKDLALKLVADIQYPTRFPFKVMDYHGSAGFYASVWGALPFTVSQGPWERFTVFEVQAPLRGI